MGRSRIYGDELRRRLIEAAAESVAKGGVEAVSLRTLAASQGTSTNAIYSMFGGKNQLLGAVLEEALLGFTAAQTELIGCGDAVRDLLQLGRSYRRWARAHPALYLVMFNGQIKPPGESTSSPPVIDEDHAGAAAMRPLLAVVGRLIDEGLFLDVPVELAATSVWSAVHGMVSLEAVVWPDMDPADADELFDQHLQSIVRAWLRDGTAGRPPESGGPPAGGRELLEDDLVDHGLAV